MSPKWRRRTSASCDAVQVSFFFQRLCLAAPAPVSSGLPRCWNAACRTDSIQKKSMTGVGSEHANVDCKSWRKLSAPFKFSVTPRLDVWTNPLFLDQLRRSDAVQERAVLNETPEVAEISYFFFPPLRLLLLLFDCTNLPSHRARLKIISPLSFFKRFNKTLSSTDTIGNAKSDRGKKVVGEGEGLSERVKPLLDQLNWNQLHLKKNGSISQTPEVDT